MDKLQKVGLTALGTALVSTASFAGDMAVTGSAQITYAGNDNTTSGNRFSMSDTLSFSGSGELDNGWTMTFSHAIDLGANDANSIALDMGDMGKLTFAHLQDDSGRMLWYMFQDLSFEVLLYLIDRQLNCKFF